MGSHPVLLGEVILAMVQGHAVRTCAVWVEQSHELVRREKWATEEKIWRMKEPCSGDDGRR
jgi:hypothetical protein